MSRHRQEIGTAYVNIMPDVPQFTDALAKFSRAAGISMWQAHHAFGVAGAYSINPQRCWRGIDGSVRHSTRHKPLIHNGGRPGGAR